MTQIMVAQRSGILRAPDGKQYRLVRGQTLADGRHPAVTGSPASWRPMHVELAVDDSADCPPDGFDQSDQIAELEETAEQYRSALQAVADLLDERGLLAGVDREQEGWLLDRLGELLPPGDPADVAPVPAAPKPPHAPAAQLADPETSEGRAAIREWAWSHGQNVSERGQLPKAVIDAYRAAHGG
jgi:hypothetical protein